MKQDSGLSILELMVAAGILGVIMAGVASMSTFTNRSVMTVKSASDFNSLVTSIQGVLNNASGCKAVFSDNITLDPLPTSAQPKTLAELKTNGASGASIVKMGVLGNALDVTKLEFTSADPIGTSTTQYMVKLQLTANKVVGGGAVGSQTMQHEFPLSVTLDAAKKIIACSGISDSIWQKAANDVDIYYNGGNVGIGTSAPQSTLHLDPTDPTLNPWIRMTDLANTSWTLGADDNPNGFQISKVGSVPGEFFIADNGSVGIGTSTPGNQLHIKGEADVILEDTGGTGTWVLHRPGNAGAHRWQAGANNYGHSVIDETLGATCNVGGGETTCYRMTINNSGNVGIGTVVPQAPLHVNGPPGVVAQFETTTGHKLQIFPPGNIFAINPDGKSGALNIDANSFSFRISGAGGFLELVNSGNVGIGTSTPQAKLEVAGEVKIANSGAACSAANEGAMRYNSTSKAMEFCNGTSWAVMGGGGSIDYDNCKTITHSYNHAGILCGGVVPEANAADCTGIANSVLVYTSTGLRYPGQCIVAVAKCCKLK